MRRIFATAAGLVASLAIAPTALAAPSQKGAVSAQKPTFAWTGTAYGTNVAGEPCNTDHSCEDILVEVKDPGFLNVTWDATAPGGTPAWLSATIFQSDATGAEGDDLGDGGGLADSGSVGTPVDPGFYVVQLQGLATTLADYKATAELQPDDA